MKKIDKTPPRYDADFLKAKQAANRKKGLWAVNSIEHHNAHFDIMFSGIVIAAVALAITIIYCLIKR